MSPTPAAASDTAGVRQRPTTPGPLGPEHRLVTIAVISLVTIIAFESMAVGTAMPVVAADLGAVRSYGLAFSVLLTAELVGTVLSGLWVQRVGPTRMILGGAGLLAVGSLVAGLATTFPLLLAGRLVFGLGSGLGAVVIYVVIGRAYPAPMRPKVFSWMSAAWVLPSLLGPPVAGFLATSLSWRWVFLVVLLPIAATAAVIVSQRERLEGGPETAGPGASEEPRTDDTRRVARTGVLLALAAGAFQLGAERLVPLDAGALVLTVVGVLGLVVLAPRLVPAGTVRLRRGLPAVIASRFVLASTFHSTMAFVPLMLVKDRGLTPGLAGAVVTVGAVGWSLGSAVQGRDALADRKPDLVAGGGAALAAGIGLFAAVAGLGLPTAIAAGAAAVMGVGMGLAMASTSVLSLSLSDAAEHGRTASALMISDVLGSVVGLAVAGGVFAALHDPAGTDREVFALLWTGASAFATVAFVAGRRIRR